jgi:enoyl-CoA hydratase
MLIEKRDDGVAVITFNRPDRHNAVNRVMTREIGELPAALLEDDGVRAAVITGTGPSFCSGADVGDAVRPDQDIGVWGMNNEPQRLVEDFLRLDKPVITAVKGYALGLGCTVALLGDVIIAGQSARFGDTHVRIGMTAGDGGALVWPALIGPQRAKYYLMTGQHVPADKAEQLGMVHMVVEDDKVLDEALAIASQLAAGPQYAIRSTKASINRWMRLIAHETIPYSLAVEALSMLHPDHKEAVTSFMEKRPPSFSPNPPAE